MDEFIPKLMQRFKLPHSDRVLYISHDRTNIGDSVEAVECSLERVHGTIWYHDHDDTKVVLPIRYGLYGATYFTYKDIPFFLSGMDYTPLHEFVGSGSTIDDLTWSLIFAGVGEYDIGFVVGRGSNAKRCRCIDASNLLINKNHPSCVGWMTLQSYDGTFASAICVDELYENLHSGAMHLDIPAPISVVNTPGAILYMRHHKIPLFEK